MNTTKQEKQRFISFQNNVLLSSEIKADVLFIQRQRSTMKIDLVKRNILTSTHCKFSIKVRRMDSCSLLAWLIRLLPKYERCIVVVYYSK